VPVAGVIGDDLAGPFVKAPLGEEAILHDRRRNAPSHAASRTKAEAPAVAFQSEHGHRSALSIVKEAGGAHGREVAPTSATRADRRQERGGHDVFRRWNERGSFLSVLYAYVKEYDHRSTAGNRGISEGEDLGRPVGPRDLDVASVRSDGEPGDAGVDVADQRVGAVGAGGIQVDHDGRDGAPGD
jgi:hypothetical protein